MPSCRTQQVQEGDCRGRQPDALPPDQGEFPLDRTERGAAHQARQQFLLANRPQPARHALPAGLIAEEPGDSLEEPGHLHGVIEHQDDTGSQRRADGAHALERERGVQRARTDERAGRAAEQHRL